MRGHLDWHASSNGRKYLSASIKVAFDFTGGRVLEPVFTSPWGGLRRKRKHKPIKMQSTQSACVPPHSSMSIYIKTTGSDTYHLLILLDLLPSCTNYDKWIIKKLNSSKVGHFYHSSKIYEGNYELIVLSEQT